MLSEQSQQTEAVVSGDAGAGLTSDEMELLTSETLQPLPRGRSTHCSATARRPASSVSALDRVRNMPPNDSLRRTFRSSSPRIISRQPVIENTSTTSDDTDAMESADNEDLDDVDFWGRQSPRERARHDTEIMEAGSVDGSDEDDDEDELMDDELEDDDDDDEGDGDDYMEIFGHR